MPCRCKKCTECERSEAHALVVAFVDADMEGREIIALLTENGISPRTAATVTLEMGRRY